MPKKRAKNKLSTAKKPSTSKKSREQKSPTAKKPLANELKGWTEIAAFLSIPVSTAHRWARDGMPVRRDGRKMAANAEELRAWLGRESHMNAPAQILTDESDVASALKQSIAAMKKRSHKLRPRLKRATIFRLYNTQQSIHQKVTSHSSFFKKALLSLLGRHDGFPGTSRG